MKVKSTSESTRVFVFLKGILNFCYPSCFLIASGISPLFASSKVMDLTQAMFGLSNLPTSMTRFILKDFFFSSTAASPNVDETRFNSLSVASSCSGVSAVLSLTLINEAKLKADFFYGTFKTMMNSWLVWGPIFKVRLLWSCFECGFSMDQQLNRISEFLILLSFST